MIGRLSSAVVTAMVLFAAPASAQDAPVSVNVSVADLDVSSDLGQARLERRVRQAAQDICGQSPGGIRANEAFSECRDEVMIDARDKIAALTTSKAKKIQVARRTR